MSGPQTKTIGGLAVTCTSLEPADAYDLLPELAPALGAVFRARDGLTSIDGVEAALRGAGQALGSGKLTELMIRLLRTTVISTPSSEGGNHHRVTDRATFNLAFAGRPWAAIPVAAFAFEVTYGGFFDAVAPLLGAMSPSGAGP